MNIHCIFGEIRDRYLIDLIPFYIVLKYIFSKNAIIVRNNNSFSVKIGRE
jgi:hypothetical protein